MRFPKDRHVPRVVPAQLRQLSAECAPRAAQGDAGSFLPNQGSSQLRRWHVACVFARRCPHTRLAACRCVIRGVVRAGPVSEAELEQKLTAVLDDLLDDEDLLRLVGEEILFNENLDAQKGSVEALQQLKELDDSLAALQREIDGGK